MAKIHLKGTEISVYGSLPGIGTTAPDFVLTRNDLSFAHFVDTGTCTTAR
ncbi:hypothetical protein [Bacteroidetes bacterium endosymbiont of Geopemphigus sp.]|nr:hypothetical protein [Bacteroidetes bacterium endosymbiont of Geopemphigus sp.]